MRMTLKLAILSIILSGVPAMAEGLKPERPIRERVALLMDMRLKHSVPNQVQNVACTGSTTCCCKVGSYSTCTSSGDCSGMGGSCSGSC